MQPPLVGGCGLEHVLQADGRHPGRCHVIGFERREHRRQGGRHGGGGRWRRNSDELAHSQEGSRGSGAVPRRDGPLPLLEEDHEILRPQAGQRLERLFERRLRLGPLALAGQTVEPVLDLHPVRRRRRGLAVDGERLLALAAPLQGVPLERKEIGPARCPGERLGDGGRGLVALLQAQGRYGEVGVREGIVRRQLHQLAEDLRSLARPLVFELREPEAAQRRRLR